MNIGVAAVQFAPRFMDVEANLGSVTELLTMAARSGVELAVFPECSLSGYLLDRDEAMASAVEVPGPVTDRLGALADSLETTLVIGLLEQTAYGLHNTAITFIPHGVPAIYRKTHLPRMGVDRFCAPGTKPYLPVETPVGSLGVLVCYDLRFPEPARILALAGARMLVVPTNWPATATDYPDFLLRARASENRVPIVAANRSGMERGGQFIGRSQVVAFDGTVVAEAGDGEETLIVHLESDPGPAGGRVAGLPDGPGGLLADRRNDLYELTNEPAIARSRLR